MTPQRQDEVRRALRPPAVPDDVDDPRVYEQVLVEGSADDVRRFIDVDELVALWDELYLPDHVRRAWAAWLARHRGVQLSC